MRGERNRTARRRPPHIDLVPLLDTVFLLLFFFLCAAIVQSGSVKTRLSGKSEKTEQYQTVAITSRNVTGLTELNGLPVLIKADADVRFSRVDDVLHHLQERGIAQVNFAL
ncbi:MAG: biopolymer transporter ExbD [Candidatus Margulisbacteria bacterium]|jgi:biopolymer transport protein ExbD|nr:biopolymer transporter ExbD [Candidatus Margulisiibacteriota bacterium]